jgi:hypothetical protein
MRRGVRCGDGNCATRRAASDIREAGSGIIDRFLDRVPHTDDKFSVYPAADTRPGIWLLVARRPHFGVRNRR